MDNFSNLHKTRLIKEIDDIGKLKKEEILKSLIDFHSKNKYLLFTFNPSEKDKMGAILGNLKKNMTYDEVDFIYSDYRSHLLKLTESNVTTGKFINSLEHIKGYFNLTDDEKFSYLTLLEEFKTSENPLDILEFLYNCAKKYNNEYILYQSVFKIKNPEV